MSPIWPASAFSLKWLETMTKPAWGKALEAEGNPVMWQLLSNRCPEQNCALKVRMSCVLKLGMNPLTGRLDALPGSRFRGSHRHLPRIEDLITSLLPPTGEGVPICQLNTSLFTGGKSWENYPRAWKAWKQGATLKPEVNKVGEILVAKIILWRVWRWKINRTMYMMDILYQAVPR